ncbi:MAG: ATP synthase F1 subunit epsilon [Myxococcota bacterium]|nr:ATP synthase F1 subunit epsilon [Myxococcota bacterium]
MSETLAVKVVTPRGSLIDEVVGAFTARSEMGEFSILPNHRAIMAALAVGPMVIDRPQTGKAAFALDRGFLEAGADHVNVITEQCVPAEEIDATAVAQEVTALEGQLSEMDLGTPEATQVIADLEWAKTRLIVAQMS